MSAPREISRYVLGPRLGAGGFGSVYRARHAVLGTDVALKVLARQHATNVETVERFLREAKAAAAIGSEHIVQVFDAGVDDGVPFLALELLSGEDLQARLTRNGALPLELTIDIALQILEALDASHACGIVHRDLKPANVFLTTGPDGTPFVKLLDFGMSKIVEPGQRERLTQSGIALGTPAYMAPEQLFDSRSADHRADLYALGMMLFEALAGRLPYRADSFGELLVRVSGDEPPPLHTVALGVPPPVSDVIGRALRMAPDARFASAREMAEALRASVASVPVTRSVPVAEGQTPPDGVITGPLGHAAPVERRPEPPTETIAERSPERGVAINQGGFSPRLLVGVAIAAMLAIGTCTIAGVFAWGLGDRKREPSTRPFPRPTMPAPTPIAPSIPSVPSPPRPSTPSPPAPVAIAPGTDPCRVPVVHEVDCSRAGDREIGASCRSDAAELHILAIYESTSDDTVNVQIARTVAPIVLVLSAYASTKWQITLEPGARVERVIATGHTRSEVMGIPARNLEWVDGSPRGSWPISGWDWEGFALTSGRRLAEAAEERTHLGLRSYAGCYDATRFRIGQSAPE